MCHRRITADRRADSDFHISFYGSLLSEKDLSDLSGGSESDVRCPFGCLWFLRPGTDRTVDERHDRKRRKYDADSLYFIGNYDSSDDYRCVGNSNTKCTGALL